MNSNKVKCGLGKYQIPRSPRHKGYSNSPASSFPGGLYQRCSWERLGGRAGDWRESPSSWTGIKSSPLPGPFSHTVSKSQPNGRRVRNPPCPRDPGLRSTALGDGRESNGSSIDKKQTSATAGYQGHVGNSSPPKIPKHTHTKTYI